MKSFQITLQGHSGLLEADEDGADRYMVRLSVPGRLTRVRIGYLTGCRRNWLAEFFGSRPSVPAKSAKAACLALAEIAINQQSIAPFLSPSSS
jgi:hypothetical protein